MNYARMRQLSKEFYAKSSRLMPCYWVLDLVFRCLDFFRWVLDTRWLNCASVARFVNTKEFVAWVVIMIFANAAFIGITSDTLIKRSIDAYENQSTMRMEGTVAQIFEIFFNVSFAVELLLRFFALEGRFCVGEGGRWNIFDALL